MNPSDAYRLIAKDAASGALALAALRAAASAAKEENERLRDVTHRLADEEETP